MKNFINGIIDANGEQWIGFIALSFIASLLTIAAFAISQDHEVECQYMKSYGENGVTHYRVMNQVNWAGDSVAFSSINPDKTLSLFDSVDSKCPVK